MLAPLTRNLPAVTAPCALVARARRRITSLASAPAGNLVKFLGKDGAQYWGKLTEGKADRAERYARIIDSEACIGAGSSIQKLALEQNDDDEEEVEILRVLPPLPVVPAPAIIFMGLNYKKHAEETGSALPRFPVFAFKNPACAIGTGSAISIPSIAREKPEVDFEAELAIVIGRPIRDAATPEEALAAVLGVTSANDVTARRWQGKKGGGQWSRSKSFDTFCPLGPSIIPLERVAEALGPGGAGLQLQTKVNGEVMQDGNTTDMIFGIAEIVSYLSQGTTLLPGTFILTGTPPGVGYVREPPVYLKEGDVVEVELEGCGVLSNPVVNGP